LFVVVDLWLVQNGGVAEVIPRRQRALSARHRDLNTATVMPYAV
jgi:hypothetical protein